MSYYYTNKSGPVYNIKLSSIHLSGLLKDRYEAMPQDALNEADAFMIDLDDNFDILDQYFKIWSSKPELADYVKEEPIKTPIASHVLLQEDIQVIQDYLLQQNRYPEKSYKYSDIMNLSKLLKLVEHFRIESFRKKIYAYIAVLIWNSSAADFAELSRE